MVAGLNSDEQNAFEQIIQSLKTGDSEEKTPGSAQSKPSGIDPDLVPYLEADSSDLLPITDISADEEQRKRLLNLLETYHFPLPVPDEEEAEDSELSDLDPGEQDLPASWQNTASQTGEDQGDRAEERNWGGGGQEGEEKPGREGQDPYRGAEEQGKEIYQRLILRRPEHKISPTKRRVRLALEYLGDPQLTFKALHIAGTNGKTSTSRIADSLLSAQGHRVGRFTSPHLQQVTERISIDGQPISWSEFCEQYHDSKALIDLVESKTEAEGIGKLSFFEYLTVLAFQSYAAAPISVGVIEVGMGGRWDSTNVLDSPVQIITPISYDHQQWLGDTIEEIAAEKAGIIQAGASVIVGKQDPRAAQVIAQEAQKKQAKVYWEDIDFQVFDRRSAQGSGQVFSLRTPSATYLDLYLPLIGKYQASNAAAAIVAVETLGGGKPLSDQVLESGLNTASSPGRLEILRTSPTVIADAAHNLAGAESLRQALEDDLSFSHLVGVFSAMTDKNIEGILSAVEPVMEQLVLTQMPGERAAQLSDLTAVAQDVFGEGRVHACQSLTQALDLASGLAESSLDPAKPGATVVFGSVVLAGHARDLLLDNAQ